jgi:Flp pilus assembly protein TadG
MLKSFLELISRLTRKQDGQVIILGVGLFILTLAALMITVDVGYWLSDKRNAQNVADAVALAAVQELPDTAAAVDAGRTWANANGIDPETQLATDVPCAGVTEDSGRFCFEDMTDDDVPDLVRVQVERDSRSFIAGAFGVATPTVRPPAAAAKIRAYGACVLPWAIDAHPDFEDPYAYEDVWGVLGDPPDPDLLLVFQLSPGGGFAGDDTAPGNFGALGVYGANASDYRDTIVNECGSQGESACDSDSQAVTPGGTMDCDIQTGNLGGNTNTALSDRADRYGEVFPYTDCDASSNADAVDKADSCLGRLVVLAIIKDFPESGFEPVEIYGIANFYVAGWDRCPPLNDGNCFGPVPDEGLVWGYLLLEEMGGTAAWQFDFSQSSNNPYAPVIVSLVE